MRTAMVIVVIATSLCCGSGVVNAQDASRRALAEELLGAMNMKDTAERAFATPKKMIPMQIQQMRKEAEQMGEGSAAENPQVKAIDKVMPKVMDVLAEDLSWKEMKDDYVKIYADAFTEDELKGMIAFYKSPVGQALAKKQPDLLESSASIGQKRMLMVMQKIRPMVMEARQTGSPQEKLDKAQKKNALPVKPNNNGKNKTQRRAVPPSSPQNEQPKTP